MYNIYWNRANGNRVSEMNVSFERVFQYVDAILTTGGEVTGIIDSSKDN